MNVNLISVNGANYVYDTTLCLEQKRKKYKDITYEAALFCGRMGGECYSSYSLSKIMQEDEKTTLGRMKFCLNKMHHSLFEHAKFTFEFTQMPKIVQMILNNTYVYATSERSARYTNFCELIQTETEKKLYYKWQEKIQKAIKECYKDKFTQKEIEKLAQENARYMISVFVPSSMVYTVSLRDLNYTLYDIKNFLSSDFEKESKLNKEFMELLRPKLEEFIFLMEPFVLEGLTPKYPRQLQMFKKPKSKVSVADASYRLNYYLSFAGFAQEHRHRSIRHTIELTENYYIPKIVMYANLEEEWLTDIRKVKFPQGMVVDVTESGEIEDFVAKCYERCCGRAQREIEENTCKSLEFLRTSKNEEVTKYLEETTGCASARCKFPNYKCVEVCKFGANQRERLV